MELRNIKNKSIDSVIPPPEPKEVNVKQLKKAAVEAQKASREASDSAKKKTEQKQQDINEVVRKFNEAAFNVNKRIKFRIHPVNNRQMIQVIDSETNKVIMEVPPVELVNLSAKIHIFVGMMMDRLS